MEDQLPHIVYNPKQTTSEGERIFRKLEQIWLNLVLFNERLKLLETEVKANANTE